MAFLFFKSFINNDMRTFGLSQYVAVSVTEVSDVDVDFTEAVLMLIILIPTTFTH